MPIYEYRCEKCGDFETTQRITDAPLQRCPTCRRKVRRLISSTSFQLKGSGWYVTDYARSGGGANAGDKGSSGNGGNKSEAKSEAKSESESKSEAKSESKSDAKSADSGKSTKASGDTAKAGA
jgi:putative FmdB family regulatory protein